MRHHSRQSSCSSPPRPAGRDVARDGTRAAEPRGAGRDRAARPRSDGDAGVRHRGLSVFYNVQERAREGRPHTASSCRGSPRNGTPLENKNYTFFLKQGRPLPERTRDEGRRREVRLRSGDETRRPSIRRSKASTR